MNFWGGAADTGPSGQDGQSGADGTIGPTGPPGSDGAAGAGGVDGADGVPGVAGADGVDGADSSATVTYVAKVDLSEGQPVVLDFDSTVAVTSVTSGITSEKIIGVTLSSADQGNPVQVRHAGFADIARTAVPTGVWTPDSSLQTIGLTSATTDTSPVGQLWNFQDSNAVGGTNYANSENYKITFDAGAGGSWQLNFNDFAFESSQTRQYDRLGLQVSTTGTEGSFVNASISWFQASGTGAPTWSSTFPSSLAWNAGTSSPGYIFPATTTRAILLGWQQTATVAAPEIVNFRYIRFYFKSDSGSNYSGWDIDLVSSNSSSATSYTVPPYWSALYTDPNDYRRVTETQQSGENVVGYMAGPGAISDSIHAFIPYK